MTPLEELRALANAVYDATEEGENTQKRVGQAFKDIVAILENLGGDKFLRKDKDDTANGHVTLAGGATVKNGLQTDNINNSDEIKTKDLTVTGTARFFELELARIKASGGAHLSTPADGFTIDLVEEIEDTNRIRLYWLSEKDNNAQLNMWKPLDQAICMNFNQATVGETHNAANKYYWALVTDVSGAESVERTVDGVTSRYNWIELSTETVDGTLNPETGDEIAQLGYRGTDDVARQSAIYESAYSSLDTELTPPFIAFYRGINDFSLSRHRYTFFDATSGILKGVTIQQLEDVGLRMEIDSTVGIVLDFGETTTLTCTVVDALWNDKTGDVDHWYIERDTGDTTNDTAWLDTEKVKNFNKTSDNPFKGVPAVIDIAFNKDVCDIAKDTLLTTIFTITAYSADKDTDGSAKVMARRSLKF